MKYKSRRINKYLSESGYCSRRQADKLIEEERVMVNGIIAKVGGKVCDDDVIKIDGEIVKQKKTKNNGMVLQSPVYGMLS